MLHNWSFSEHRKLCLPRTPKKRITAITSYNNIMDWVKMAVTSNAGFLELQKQRLIQKNMLMTWSHNLVPVTPWQQELMAAAPDLCPPHSPVLCPGAWWQTQIHHTGTDLLLLKKELQFQWLTCYFKPTLHIFGASSAVLPEINPHWCPSQQNKTENPSVDEKFSLDFASNSSCMRKAMLILG